MIQNCYHFLQRRIKYIVTAFCLSIVLSSIGNLGMLTELSPALGQSIRPDVAAEQLYQSLAFLPLENNYIDQSSGKIATDNTLIERFIRYHEYVKSRPLRYRFDWQLTFADYFDVNEPIRESRYPGHRYFTVNPLEKDRSVITKLTREQRNQLIDALLAIYNPQQGTSEKPVSIPNNSLEQTESKPSLPQPGDAELLLLN